MLSISQESLVFRPRCGVMPRRQEMVAAVIILYLCMHYPFVCSAKSPEESVEIGMDVVRYGDFGACGDGLSDDIDAIAKAHEFANQHGLPVRADDGATYYIGGKDRTVVIQTNTDFGSAKFIIDDASVENRRAHIFVVPSTQKAFNLEGISSLKRNQPKIDVLLPDTCLIGVTDSNVKRYIRYGANQNKGASQTDIFIAEKDGSVDMNAPIIWDFDQITRITAQPIDTLYIDDSQHPDGYSGSAIFANFNQRFTDDSYVEKYPYIKTKEVNLKNVTSASGKPLRLSDNPFMFKDVTVRSTNDE